MERRGKGLAAGRQRKCARVGEWLKMELACVVKRQLEEGLTILGFLDNLT